MEDLSKNPGLLGILLITQSRPGPKLVFHYPASLGDFSHGLGSGLPRDENGDDSDDENVASDQASLSKGPVELTSIESDNSSDSNFHSVLGLSSESLEKMLSPGRESARKRFELCLNGITFVGFPVYAPENGKWSEKQQEAARKNDPPERTPSKSIPIVGPNAYHDFTHIPESLDSQFGVSIDSNSTTSGITVEQMTMFHVVLALRPDQSQGKDMIRSVYRDVVVTLNKALCYCQEQANYVSNETRCILAIKAKNQKISTTREALWDRIVVSSELAGSFREIYDKISHGQVARIRLNGIEMSLQIEASADRITDVEPQSALLLLEPKEIILRELGHPEASPLAQFVREHTPTKNLQKHAVILNVPIKDLLYLACHLIKWRKARKITPLHRLNMYVIHPDAPLHSMPRHVESYSKQFPTLPSLQDMIKVLGGGPINYWRLIPSRDHRGPFMDILAYLVQHNFVVQLKQYGWLRVPKHAGVDRDARVSSRRTSDRSHLTPYAHFVEEDDAVSVQSDRTTIPFAAETSSKEQHAAFGDGVNRGFAGANGAVIIVDPTQPSDEERKLIARVKDSVRDDEFRLHFSSIVPYLDGKHAFEEIGAQLSLKRAKLEEWLTDLEKDGNLRTVRY